MRRSPRRSPRACGQSLAPAFEEGVPNDMEALISALERSGLKVGGCQEAFFEYSLAWTQLPDLFKLKAPQSDLDIIRTKACAQCHPGCPCSLPLPLFRLTLLALKERCLARMCPSTPPPTYSTCSSTPDLIP